MDKAKMIWTTWRKTSVAKRDEYCVSLCVCVCVCVCDLLHVCAGKGKAEQNEA